MPLADGVVALAAAIRNKINEMMPRLLPSGGTTGQVLAKASGTAYNVSWQTIASGAATIVVFTDQAAFDAYTPAAGEIAVLDGDGLASISLATDAAAPATPAADTVVIFGGKEAGRDMPSWKDPTGILHRMQAWLGRSHVSWAQPTGNGTTINYMGAGFTATGTATAASVAATNIHTALRRLNYLVTTAATTAVAGWRQGILTFFIGAPGAAYGGFHYVCRFGRATGNAANATLRGFTGFVATTAAPSDADPSASTNIIGVGCDAADTNYQIMHNDASGAATKIDTGFAKATADATEAYELQLYAPTGRGGQVDYLFKRLSDGASVSGSITTNLPTDTTLLGLRGFYSVGGTSSVIGYALMNLFVECEW